MSKKRVQRIPTRVAALVAGTIATALVPSLAHAQATRPTTAPAAAVADETLVALNLPENAPLKVLIDYVSQEFSLNILYDEQVGNQRITIKAPTKLPRSAVPNLLDSALRMKGLAMIDAGQAGWRRVVPLQQAARVPGAAAAAGAGGPGEAVTQVFRLKYSEATKLDTVVKPFLTQPGASSFPLPEQSLLVVSDYAANLKRIAELIESVDRPNQEVGIEFVPVKHADPARLTQQLDQLLRARLRTEGGGDRLTGAVETTYDARTNQVVVIAPKDRLADAKEIISRLDSTVAEEQSPIKFYKLANTTAAEVLATIRSLEGEQDETASGATPGPTGPAAPGTRLPGRPTGRTSVNAPAVGASGASQTGMTREPNIASPAITPSATGAQRTGTSTTLAPAAASAGGYERQSITSSGGTTARAPGSTLPEAPGPLREALRTRQARVTADPHTNTIIVVAPPDVQRLYEQLIRALDKRRPQVLIQATIVTIDTSNNFQLGVEIGRLGGFDRNGVLTFTSFGLSTPDPQTGRLSLIPGAGFNGALISSDIADVVVRALKQNNRAKVSSAPRILVNDNNVGTLSSIAEFPYASVNASNTVATTSFGDYAQAGTEITVTPHISESDYLQLEYVVSLSSFTGDPVQQGGTVLPPPRKSDTVQSQVTIPDGSTIIVGGLNQRNLTRMKQSVPFLGDIPVLEYLFSNRTTNEQNTTLFVFIRPVILRDDKFEDLKFLSAEDVRQAGIPADFPTSEPLMMR